MTRGYLEKFLRYMKQVYDIESELGRLSDHRRNPMYQTSEVALPVLFGFLMRIQSFNELKFRLECKDYNKIISRNIHLSKIDTIRDTLKVMDIDAVRKMNTNIIKKSRRNKAFQNGSIDGYTVAAVDGTKLFGSYKKSCGECLTTPMKNGKRYLYHRRALKKCPRFISGLKKRHYKS